MQRNILPDAVDVDLLHGISVGTLVKKFSSPDSEN
jgi:hypothetical protein